MHIHMSKCMFSNAHLYKFIKFFADNPTYINRIAERNANDYCYTEKKEYVKRKAINKYGNERYEQVNCQNEDTVEVRCFQGVTTKSGWLKNLEFVYSLFIFTKDTRLKDINVNTYVEFLKQNKEQFKNICAFLSI